MNEVEIPQEYRALADLMSNGYQAPDPFDPEVRRRRSRRRRIRLIVAGVLTLAVLGSAGLYSHAVLLAPVGDTAPVVSQPTLPVPAAHVFPLPRSVSAAMSVAGAEEFPALSGTDGIVTLHGDNSPQPIASISKVITSLVILEARPLGAGEAGPTITFTKADDDLYDKYYLAGATIQSMKAGATMSERDLLGVMMLVSASNYAEAAATWAFGSPAGYRAAAARWLAANGLTGTTIVEPTGIDPRNTSTPSDLIAIGKLAMAHPALSEIVQTRSITVAPLGTLTNTNPVLGANGVNGIKTGTLEESGANLLFSATVEVGLDAPLTVVGVILGSPEQYVAGADALLVLDSLKEGFHKVKVVAAGSVFGEYMAPWDDTARAVASNAAELLTWSDTPVTSAMTIENVETARSGAEVGSVTYTAGARTVTVPLKLGGDLNGPGGWWRLGHPGYLLGW